MKKYRMTAENQYFSTSLEKGLKILSLFSTENPGLTQSEISRTSGINMTSTYRFVNTLVRLGYLEKDARTKELRLGIRSLALTPAARSPSTRNSIVLGSD